MSERPNGRIKRYPSFSLRARRLNGRPEFPPPRLGEHFSTASLFFGFLTRNQIDVVNSLQLLTAKPVTYLVNLSEKDYIRKKNKWSDPLHPL